MTSQKASLCQYQNSVLSVKEKGQKKKSFLFMKYLLKRLNSAYCRSFSDEISNSKDSNILT